ATAPGDGRPVARAAGGAELAHLARRRLGRDAVLFVVLGLQRAAPVGLADRALHRVGDAVGVHDDLAVHVARRAADRLDERARRTRRSASMSNQSPAKIEMAFP